MFLDKDEMHTPALFKEDALASCHSPPDCNYDADIRISHSEDTSTFNHKKVTQTKRASQAGWTEKEDDMLAEVVKKYKGRNWKKIAECMPGRTDVQCLHRWQKVVNPELFKGPWTKEEDESIVDLVKKYGAKKWSSIAKYLPGRIGKQCRERWHNHLDPAVKKDAWTKEEESVLSKCHQIYGNKWAEIAKFLPGRTDNSIKNHWNCSMKKRLDLKRPRSSNSRRFDAESCIPEKYGKPEALPVVESGRIPYKNEGNVLRIFGVEVGIKKPPEIEENISSETTIDYMLGGSHDVSCAASTPKNTKTLDVFDTGSQCSLDLTLSLSSVYGSRSGSGTDNAQVSKRTKIQNSSSPSDRAIISSSCLDSESILRNLAMSYKDTPSIIRKKTCRKQMCDTYSSRCSSPSTRNVVYYSNNCGNGTGSSTLDPGSIGSEASGFGRLLERRLDYAFDMEADHTTYGCSPSSKEANSGIDSPCSDVHQDPQPASQQKNEVNVDMEICL